MKKFKHILSRPKGFHLLTDHKNLVFILDPGSLQLRKSTTERLQRIASELSQFNYAIYHLAGAENLWADIASRWHSGVARVMVGNWNTSTSGTKSRRYTA